MCQSKFLLCHKEDYNLSDTSSDKVTIFLWNKTLKYANFHVSTKPRLFICHNKPELNEDLGTKQQLSTSLMRTNKHYCSICFIQLSTKVQRLIDCWHLFGFRCRYHRKCWGNWRTSCWWENTARHSLLIDDTHRQLTQL